MILLSLFFFAMVPSPANVTLASTGPDVSLRKNMDLWAQDRRLSSIESALEKFAAELRQQILLSSPVRLPAKEPYSPAEPMLMRPVKLGNMKEESTSQQKKLSGPTRFSLRHAYFIEP